MPNKTMTSAYLRYAKLGPFLRAQEHALIRMTFDEVQTVVGNPLPRSARYQAWWSNDPSNNAMTRVWLDAGFKTEQVDMERRTLVFRRAKPRQPPPPVSASSPGISFRERLSRAAEKTKSSPVPTETIASRELIHPAFGSMKGLIQVQPDVDLTEPADPEWGEVLE